MLGDQNNAIVIHFDSRLHPDIEPLKKLETFVHCIACFFVLEDLLWSDVSKEAVKGLGVSWLLNNDVDFVEVV